MKMSLYNEIEISDVNTSTGISSFKSRVYHHLKWLSLFLRPRFLKARFLKSRKVKGTGFDSGVAT